MSSEPKLQVVNIANFVAYILNVAVTYGVGASGRFPTNAEMSEKYQTLVTPAGYAFAIWGIIFSFQLVWSIIQLLPKYRSTELVVHGVGFDYVAVCFAQIMWTVFFSTENIALSLLAMIAILVPLIKILTTTSALNSSFVDYWILKFPFEIHAAWIMAATLVNINVVFVSFKTSADIQTAAGWISLLILAIVAVLYTWIGKYVVPLVLAWASYAISVELSSPNELIEETFSSIVIANTMKVSQILTLVIILIVLVKLVYSKFVKPSQNAADSYVAMQ